MSFWEALGWFCCEGALQRSFSYAMTSLADREHLQYLEPAGLIGHVGVIFHVFLDSG